MSKDNQRLEELVAELIIEMKGMRSDTNERFDRMENRFERMEKHFKYMEKQLEKTNITIGKISQLVGPIPSILDH